MYGDTSLSTYLPTYVSTQVIGFQSYDLINDIQDLRNEKLPAALSTSFLNLSVHQYPQHTYAKARILEQT